jgi:hypothetical protein
MYTRADDARCECGRSVRFKGQSCFICEPTHVDNAWADVIKWSIFVVAISVMVFVARRLP